MHFLEAMISFANIKEARRITRSLLSERIIACANLLPGASMYLWRGRIESSREVFALCKLTRANRKLLQRRVQELHSYEVPMISFWTAETPAASGRWLRTELQGKRKIK